MLRRRWRRQACLLLGNLLENAIDACREALDTAPFIQVAGMCEDGRVFLTVDNTCKGEPRRENGRFLSSRHPGYGTGVYSVLTTAERCGGTAEFSYRDGVILQ